jgi:DNA-binding LacI/PurR family transcriptional regulator
MIVSVMCSDSSHPTPRNQAGQPRVDLTKKMRKNVSVARLLETRIRDGEYGTTALPAERELAVELGVSRVTIRRVLRDLEDRHVLERLPNRRLVSATRAEAESASRPMALLIPSMVGGTVSSDQMQWFHAVAAVAAETDTRVHLQQYFHWGDRIVTEVLKDFEHVFLIPSAETMSSEVRDLVQGKPGLVSLSVDMTDLDIPSILSFRPEDVDLVLDHLGTRGFPRMDCLNVQGRDSVINQRIERWRSYIGMHGLDGQLYEIGWEPGENVFGVAVEGAKQALSDTRVEANALFCTTLPGAIGAIQALSHRGAKVGLTLAVGTVDGEALGQYMLPGITCLERPDVKPLIRKLVHWMQQGSKPSPELGLLYPGSTALFVGESSVASLRA